MSTVKKNSYAHLVLFFILQIFGCADSNRNLANEPETVSDPVVILKLDDLWFEQGLVHPGWQRTITYLNQEKIVGTIGLVGESLEAPNEAYIRWIQARSREGHEIWNHGYCHCRGPQGDKDDKLISEFQGRSLAEQWQSLNKTQTLAREKLGLNLSSFGAPYNATDVNTAQALAKIPELKIWMYKNHPAESDKLVLSRVEELNIEYPVHIPDVNAFKRAFHKHRHVSPMIIQGHPRSWVADPARWDNFVKIIEFLKSQNAVFIRPSDLLVD